MILNALFESSNSVQPASDVAIDVPSMLRSLDEQHHCLQTQILVGDLAFRMPVIIGHVSGTLRLSVSAFMKFCTASLLT